MATSAQLVEAGAVELGGYAPLRKAGFHSSAPSIGIIRNPRWVPTRLTPVGRRLPSCADYVSSAPPGFSASAQVSSPALVGWQRDRGSGQSRPMAVISNSTWSPTPTPAADIIVLHTLKQAHIGSRQKPAWPSKP